MLISIAKITMDPRTQPRAEINSGLIAEFAEAMQAGEKFPAVRIFHDKDNVLWLTDGWHRVLAAKKVGIKSIEATIEKGDVRAAVLDAMAANSEPRGLRRSNEDKRRAVRTLLNDPEWAKWSDREIARRCGVDHKSVSTQRKSSSGEVPQIDSRLVTRGDSTFEMDVARIGKDERTIENTRPESKSTFNRTNENIDWAWWSWNPVTGCKQGCKYCYAKDIALRFTGHFKPEFHTDRLKAPQNTNPIVNVAVGSRCVFVCSMADLFGEWVPDKWISDVLAEVASAPQWIFIFLTKNPSRLVGIKWPKNAWVGSTVDVQARVRPTIDAFKKVNASVKFVSCEPFLEPISFPSMPFNWILIGAQSQTSGSPAFQPEWIWVHELEKQARANGVAVFMKPNLTARAKEYPAAS